MALILRCSAHSGQEIVTVEIHHLCRGGNKILDEFLLRVIVRSYLDESQAQFRADLRVFVQLVMVTFKVSSAQHTGVLIGSPLKIKKSMPPNEAQNMRSMVLASRKVPALRPKKKWKIERGRKKDRILF